MPKLRKDLNKYTQAELSELCNNGKAGAAKFAQATVRNFVDLYNQSSYARKYREEYTKRLKQEIKKRENAGVQLSIADKTDLTIKTMLDYCKELPDEINGNVNFAKQQLYAFVILDSWGKCDDLADINSGETSKEDLIKVYKESTELENNLLPTLFDSLSKQQNIAYNRNADFDKNVVSLEQAFIDNAVNHMYELQYNPIINNFGIGYGTKEETNGDVRSIHDNLGANIGDGDHKVSMKEMEKTNKKFPISNLLSGVDNLSNCVNDAHMKFNRKLEYTSLSKEGMSDLDMLKNFQNNFKRESTKMFSSMRNTASKITLSNRQEIVDNLFGGRDDGFVNLTSGPRGWKSNLGNFNKKTAPAVNNDLIYRKMELDAKRFQDFAKGLDANRGFFSRTSKQAKALKTSVARLNGWFKDFHEKQPFSGPPKRMTPEQEKDLQRLYKDVNEKAAAYVKYSEKQNYKGTETRVEAARSIMNLTDPESPNNVFQFIKEATPDKLISKENDEYVEEAMEKLNIVEKANKARLAALEKAKSEKMFEGKPDAEKLREEYAAKEAEKAVKPLKSELVRIKNDHVNDRAEARSADNVKEALEKRNIVKMANKTRLAALEKAESEKMFGGQPNADKLREEYALKEGNRVEKAEMARLDALKKAKSEKMFEGHPDADKLREEYAAKEAKKAEKPLKSELIRIKNDHVNDRAEARSADTTRKNVNFEYLKQKVEQNKTANKPQKKTYAPAKLQRSNSFQIQEPSLEM
ncbi:MAG: hypothetical protein J6P05_06080 [Lachnospiraceae bacterium]|nr:hypothetical protein [Lachnospiraceae bacterium]